MTGGGGVNENERHSEYDRARQIPTLVSEKPLQDHKRKVDGNIFVT
jgi:hypothetical protein